MYLLRIDDVSAKKTTYVWSHRHLFKSEDKNRDGTGAFARLIHPRSEYFPSVTNRLKPVRSFTDNKVADAGFRALVYTMNDTYVWFLHQDG